MVSGTFLVKWYLYVIIIIVDHYYHHHYYSEDFEIGHKGGKNSMGIRRKEANWGFPKDLLVEVTLEQDLKGEEVESYKANKH